VKGLLERPRIFKFRPAGKAALSASPVVVRRTSRLNPLLMETLGGQAIRKFWKTQN
jgi:hypothetical protein